MDRHGWARVAVLPFALLVTIGLAGCGSKPAAPTTNKRLTTQGPCDLAKVDDLEKIFGPLDKDPGPQQQVNQCDYDFENGSLSVSRAARSFQDHVVSPRMVNGLAM